MAVSLRTLMIEVLRLQVLRLRELPAEGVS